MTLQKKPIFITGSIRSGTTWLGKMLAQPANTLSVSEPFSIHQGNYALDDLAKNWFAYAPSMPQKQAILAFQKVLDGKTSRVFRRKQIQRYLPFTRHKRLIIKDPIACFSTPWLAENFDLNVVLIIRHPAAFALSLKRMNWNFDFSNLQQQPQLWKQFPEEECLKMQAQPTDIVHQACLLWRCIYGFLLEAYNQHPEWILLRHEALSLNPVSHFQDLYQQLDSPWDQRVEETIRAHTGRGLSAQPKQGQVHSLKRDSAASIERWKQELSTEEIDYILHETWDVAQRVYTEKEFL